MLEHVGVQPDDRDERRVKGEVHAWLGHRRAHSLPASGEGAGASAQKLRRKACSVGASGSVGSGPNDRSRRGCRGWRRWAGHRRGTARRTGRSSTGPRRSSRRRRRGGRRSGRGRRLARSAAIASATLASLPIARSGWRRCRRRRGRRSPWRRARAGGGWARGPAPDRSSAGWAPATDTAGSPSGPPEVVAGVVVLRVDVGVVKRGLVGTRVGVPEQALRVAESMRAHRVPGDMADEAVGRRCGELLSLGLPSWVMALAASGPMFDGRLTFSSTSVRSAVSSRSHCACACLRATWLFLVGRVRGGERVLRGRDPREQARRPSAPGRGAHPNPARRAPACAPRRPPPAVPSRRAASPATEAIPASRTSTIACCAPGSRATPWSTETLGRSPGMSSTVPGASFARSTPGFADAMAAETVPATLLETRAREEPRPAGPRSSSHCRAMRARTSCASGVEVMGLAGSGGPRRGQRRRAEVGTAGRQVGDGGEALGVDLEHDPRARPAGPVRGGRDRLRREQHRRPGASPVPSWSHWLPPATRSPPMRARHVGLAPPPASEFVEIPECSAAAARRKGFAAVKTRTFPWRWVRP